MTPEHIAEDERYYAKAVPLKRTFEFIVCGDCYALVPTENERAHSDWHWLTNTTIERLSGRHNDGADDGR